MDSCEPVKTTHSVNILVIVKVLSDSFLKLFAEKFPLPSIFDSAFTFASNPLHPTAFILKLQESQGDDRREVMLTLLSGGSVFIALK